MSSVVELNLDRLVKDPRAARWQNPLFPIIPVVMAADGGVTILAGLVASWTYHRIAFGTFGDITSALTLSLVVFFYFVLIAAYRRSYAINRLAARGHQLYETASAWTLVFLLLLVTAFLLKFGAEISRGATLLFFVLGGGGLLAWRALLSRMLIRARDQGALAATIVVLLSEKPLTDALNADLKRSGLRVAKFFLLHDHMDLGNVARQVRNATQRDHSVESIFVSLPWTQHERIKLLLDELAVVPLPVRLLPDPDVAAFLDKPMIQVGALRAAEIQRMPLTLSEQITKRIFDVTIAACLGILLLPLLSLCALLIKLDSAGPVIFTQTRNGFNNRTFRIYKLRTLRTLEDGPLIEQVTLDDPRLTRVGRILRHFSIDELPQLLNVLRGEMSLVGPRPHAAAHNSQYEKSIVNYAFRHHVKPGLTGWAQIHGLRGETRTLYAMQNRIDFDMWYINNWSLWLDCRIVFRTIPEVLRKSDLQYKTSNIS